MICLCFFLCGVFVIAVLWLLFSFLRLRNKKIKLITDALLHKVETFYPDYFGEIYFSSSIIKKIVSFLLFEMNTEARECLNQLELGKIEKTREYLLKNKKDYLAACLTGIYNLELAQEILLQHAFSQHFKAQMIPVYFIQGKKDGASDILNEINYKKLSLEEKAICYYFRAKFALEAGDLSNAVNDAGLSLQIYRKEKSVFEEIKCYMLLGEIYRVSALTDLSYFMYDEAKKIAELQNNQIFLADIYGNLGMLYTSQERFEAANEAFLKSVDINLKLSRKKASACIYNQLGLLNILQKQYNVANNYINNALSYTFQDTNALSYELMAKLNFAQKKYDKAIKFVRIAQERYFKNQNLTAFFEASFLEAMISFNLQNYSEAKSKLKSLILMAQENVSAFHVANAYGLLGSIYMKLKEYKKAQFNFEESIRHELKDGRIEGMITDYINLGIIFREENNKIEALAHFNEALRYAEEIQNQEFCDVIRGYIDELQ